MTTLKGIDELREIHNDLQVGLYDNQMCIRDGVIIEAVDRTSVFGFEFFCWRSPAMARELDCFIEYAKDKKCFWDIGAFDGIFSLVFAKLNPKGLVHAIEPSHEPQCRLRYNTHNAGNIECYKVAFSDFNGTIRMSREWEHLAVAEGGTEEILCYTGDSFSEDKPDIIKIDVEGHELRVLKGLEQTIFEKKPIIFLELHIGRVLDELSEIKEYIAQFYYKIIDTETGNEYEIPTHPDKSDPMQMADKRLILIPR